MKTDRIFLAAVMLLIASSASAAGALDQSVQHFQSSANTVFTMLQGPALKTAVAFFSLTLLINFSKKLYEENGASIAGVAGVIIVATMWFSASVWLINQQALFIKFYSGYITLAADFAGVSVQNFTPSALMDLCWKTTSALHSANMTAFSNSPIDFFTNPQFVILMLIVDAVVVTCFFILTMALFIAQVEFSLMLAVSPLLFALAVFQPLRNQALAPLKGFLSVGIRVLVLGLIISAMNATASALITNLQSGSVINAETADIQQSLLAAVSGLIACAALSFSAGKIASSIASGSANFSGNDALSAAARMGGVAASAGGAAAAAWGMGTSAISGASNVTKKIAEAAKAGGDMKISNPLQNQAAAAAGGSGWMQDGIANMFSSGSPITSKVHDGESWPPPRPSAEERLGKRYEQMPNPASDASAASGGTGGSEPDKPRSDYNKPSPLSQMSSSLDRGINALQSQDQATSVQVDVR